MNKLSTMINKLFTSIFSRPYFGFIQGHTYITNDEIQKLKQYVFLENNNVIKSYEIAFAKLIGDGEAVSYAAGRMGFYSLMKILNITKNDEVILLGATCAVMANAILKVGATPIYSDIDTSTFGSSANGIFSCVSSKTKMIVAQHSFGIPCDIKPIASFAKKNNIFLLEDCALTLGSKVGGVTVGNFGNAALFSTDHGKPINTITGGIIYTNDSQLVEKLRTSHDRIADLPDAKKKALWKRLLIEKKYCNPESYFILRYIDKLYTIKQRLLRIPGPFLSDDFGIDSKNSYPYPARLPTFLAALGLLELSRWPKIENERRNILSKYLKLFEHQNTLENLSNRYFDENIMIVPLRFVWFQKNGHLIRSSFMNCVEISWTWFLKPIIATDEPLDKFGYIYGSCPNSENIGKDMVNIPCNLSEKDADLLINILPFVNI
jgi:perosamine synthetase